MHIDAVDTLTRTTVLDYCDQLDALEEAEEDARIDAEPAAK